MGSQAGGVEREVNVLLWGREGGGGAGGFFYRVSKVLVRWIGGHVDHFFLIFLPQTDVAKTPPPLTHRRAAAISPTFYRLDSRPPSH